MFIAIILFLIEIAIQTAIWGGICYKIMDTKGYNSEECKLYILWGALFGILAVAAAAFKPTCHNSYSYDEDYIDKLSGTSSKRDPEQAENRPLKAGYWRCPECGTDNPSYTGSCGCGHSKYS